MIGNQIANRSANGRKSPPPGHQSLILSENDNEDETMNEFQNVDLNTGAKSQQNEFQTFGKLPAIKFTVSANVQSTFQNPQKIKNEILKHKPIDPRLIEIKGIIGNLIIIITNDIETQNFKWHLASIRICKRY